MDKTENVAQLREYLHSIHEALDLIPNTAYKTECGEEHL